jgi:hypothetical protein
MEVQWRVAITRDEGDVVCVTEGIDLHHLLTSMRISQHHHCKP